MVDKHFNLFTFQTELDQLNFASTEINRLENELDVSTCVFLCNNVFFFLKSDRTSNSLYTNDLDFFLSEPRIYLHTYITSIYLKRKNVAK